MSRIEKLAEEARAASDDLAEAARSRDLHRQAYDASCAAHEEAFERCEKALDALTNAVRFGEI